MRKVLLFFTSCFPFGNEETFIENEIDYLAKAFDKIIIVSNDIHSEQTRKVPENTIIYRKKYDLNYYQKSLSYIQVINPLFWQEIKTIRNIYFTKPTKLIINTLLQTLQKFHLWKPFIFKVISKQTNYNDSVYLYSYWNNDMAFVLAKMRKQNPKIKTFCRMHRWDIYFEENTSNYLPFRKYIFQNLDKVFSISEDGIVYTKKKLKESFKNIELSRLGVKQQKEVNLKPNNISVFLSISNIIPVKNIALIIKALSYVKSNFKWIHIGDGYLMEEIKELANKEIPGKFEFKGRMPNSAVMDYLNSTSITLFFNLSKSEGIPVSIMEAMSFGIPVIASNVGGNAEIVNNTNGILIKLPSKPEYVAKKIETFINSTSKTQQQYRNEAYDTWKNLYDADKNYSDFTSRITRL